MRQFTDYIPKYLTSTDGAKIYYEVTDNLNKPQLIFVHGLGGDLTAWDKERKYFQEKGYATIALDLRGHGYSERSTEQGFYSIEKCAQDILDLINKEKLQNFLLVGHCFGGMVSLVLESKHLTKTKGLVLIDTGYKPPTFSQIVANHKIIRKLLSVSSRLPVNISLPGHVNYENFINTSDFDRKRLFADVLHTSLKSYLLICNTILSFDGTTLLQKIKVPTLIIEGEEDTIFPPEMAQALHQRIKRSELEFIPKANHILVLNNPEILTEVIDRFYQKFHS